MFRFAYPEYLWLLWLLPLLVAVWVAADSSHAGASAVSAGSKPSVRSCPTLLRGAGV